MTQDETIRMAREAGAIQVDGKTAFYTNDLERFAALVAAHEREACAKVCEQQDKSEYPRTFIDECFSTATAVCAAAIRARGEK